MGYSGELAGARAGESIQKCTRVAEDDILHKFIDLLVDPHHYKISVFSIPLSKA
jgi:hypothetical protein